MDLSGLDYLIEIFRKKSEAQNIQKDQKNIKDKTQCLTTEKYILLSQHS